MARTERIWGTGYVERFAELKWFWVPHYLTISIIMNHINVIMHLFKFASDILVVVVGNKNDLISTMTSHCDRYDPYNGRESTELQG